MRPRLYVMACLTGIAFALFLSAPTASAQGWTRLTNTPMSSVCPPTNFQLLGGGMPAYDFAGHCYTVIDAWNSAVADTKRNRLIIFGGGHTDYNGNEVYSLDLVTKSVSTATSCGGSANGCSTNATAPTLTRLNDPSIYSAPPALNADGSPWSEHTYGSMVYFPKADKVSLWMGASPTGAYDTQLWLLDLGTMTWTNTGYSQNGNQPGTAVGGLGAYCTLDQTQADESMLCIMGGRSASVRDLIRYDVVTNTATRLVNYNTYQWQFAPTVVIDPDRKLFFAIGNGGSPGTSKMYVTDLTDPNYVQQDWTSTVTGCENLMGNPYPGLAWDPTLHKIVGYAWRNAGQTTSTNSIITFDPATKTCVTQPITGGPTADNNILTLDRGMSGRFAYFPALGKYAVVNNSAGDAYTFQLSATPTNGLGSSTLTCVDRDGDGYGTGPGCLGPDADDQDAAVHTGAQFIAKWGTLKAGLAHLGYAPNNFWYLSPAGSDSATCSDTDGSTNISTPCATEAHIRSRVAPGDLVILRGGNYSGQYIAPTVSGTAGAPIVYMAYPGEQPQWINSGGLVFFGVSYIALDGAYNSGAMNNNAGVNVANTHHMTFRHIDSSANMWNMNVTNTTAVGMSDITIAESTFHDNWSLGCGTAQHGIYIANHQDQLSHQSTTLDFNIFVRWNLLFKNCYNGLQLNGRFNNVVVEQNISHTNDQGGIAFLNGVANSRVRSNLAFNNAGTSFTAFGYADFCNAYDVLGGSVCPYDQNNNLIENNTFYATGTDPKDGSSVAGQSVVQVTNTVGVSILASNKPTYVSGGRGGTPGTQAVTFTNGGCVNVTGTMTVNGSGVPIGAVAIDSGTGQTGCTSVPTQGTVATVTGTVTFTGGQLTNPTPDFGHNTFRNNILVNYSYGGAGGYGYPQFRFDDAVYPSTSTFQNNLFYPLIPTAGTYTNVIQTVSGGTTTRYDCAAATAGSGATFGSFTGCTNADPQFVAASPSYWNTPASFNLRLQGSSPALHTGMSVGVATYDLFGNALAYPPTRGSLEVVGAQVVPAGPCDINRDGVLDNADVPAAINQVLVPATCGTASLVQAGQCTIVDVQRVIIAVGGGTCKVGI